MKPTKYFYLLLIVLFLISSIACSISSLIGNSNGLTKIKEKSLPESPGFYYYNKGDLISIDMVHRNNEDFSQFINLSENQPEFINYESLVDFNELRLYNHLGNLIPMESQEIDSAKESYYPMYLVKPSESLQEGFYCFSNEPLLNPSIQSQSFNGYCFSYGTEERLGINSDLQNIEFIHQTNGFYLVNNGESIFIPSQSSKDEILIDQLPIANQLLPTIYFKSDTYNPKNVLISWRRSIIGISFGFMDGLILDGVSENLGAKEAGIQIGDEIVSVNNQDVRGLSQKAVVNIFSSSCVPGQPISLNVLRGTETFSANPTCSLGSGTTIDDFNYFIHPDGYAQFKVNYPLYPDNVYCLFYNLYGVDEISCFKVE